MFQNRNILTVIKKYTRKNLITTKKFIRMYTREQIINKNLKVFTEIDMIILK